MARPFPRPALAAALLLALVPAAGQAAPPNGPPPLAPDAVPLDPAYDALYAAMLESSDQQAAYDGIAASIAREYAKVPDIAALEAAKPGLIDAMIKAIRPLLVSYGDRVRAQYRPRMLAAMARHLTPAEAQDLAALYRSPIGRKLMGSVSRAITADETMAGIGEAVAEGRDPNAVPVKRSQVEADMNRATATVIGELTAEDLAELGRLAKEKPALFKLAAVRGEVISLRAAMENEPPTPAEEEQLKQAVIAAIAAHLNS